MLQILHLTIAGGQWKTSLYLSLFNMSDRYLLTIDVAFFPMLNIH